MQRPALSCQCRHSCFLSLLSNSKRETVLMRQLEAALFVFGISVLAYFYGVASTKEALVPHHGRRGWLARCRGAQGGVGQPKPRGFRRAP